MTDATTMPYRVLARKYRPADFSALVGQEALVRTLTNAIASGRVAQAFVLTGVRGIGKTTTARIIARGLNCIGPDGQGGATTSPCGVCANCIGIAEDRHPDVIEMDAASRTGVDGIRDLIDGVRYLPVQARYKVYILDEVHMLSTAAFNALLKTLEEPPEHVKFVFCTTEIRKVPITVLSRCQRFDLRRLDAETMIRHLGWVAGQEHAEVAPEALALLARAAEGSVRDGLSLLDQAIAHGAGAISADQVRDMLGLADRGQVVDLFDLVMKGQIAEALAALRTQYDRGADPLAVIQDLLELTHWLTRIKVAPDAVDDVTAAETERARARELARSLSMPVLSRTWQMLLKGLGEARVAPSAIAAAEMVLVRLAYAADLPGPADLIRQLQGQGAAPGAGPAAPRGPSGGASAALSVVPRMQAQPAAAVAPAAAPTMVLKDYPALVELARQKNAALLVNTLVNHVHLVRFEQGRLELRPTAAAPRTLGNDLAQRLRDWTGQTWVVALSEERGNPTLGEVMADESARKREAALNHPAVQAVLAAFPGIEMVSVKPLKPETPESLAEVEDALAAAPPVEDDEIDLLED
ncbi:MAG: DNA polymerase III subunit gamma/tau [Alphaproteobacteria bacterium]|jgi:DNA polymerase-3 subunit gamma/tau|nr:DNA polymerase III subunit gamma/tau [Alphaproteobacteria bacterium]